MANWWRVAKASPVHTLEARCHLLSEPGCQAGFADAAYAQHRDQATTFFQHPPAQQRQLLVATDKGRRVRRLTPIVRALRHTSAMERVIAWRQGGLRSMTSEESREPLFI